MSRTYKDIRKVCFSRENRKAWDACYVFLLRWYSLKINEPDRLVYNKFIHKYWFSINKFYEYQHYYCSRPRKWNNQFHDRPMRRQTKQLIKKSIDFPETDQVFPIFGKPFVYYD